MKPEFFENLIDLFYPRVCPACGNSLTHNEQSVCLTCRCLLPKTRYEFNDSNPLALSFFGQIRFHAVTAEFFFSKNGKVQSLIHALKYNGDRDAGLFLGQELGKSLKDAPLFQDLDYLIPIPLHPKKEQIRGYNQSQVIAEGMEDEMNVPIAKNTLVRKVFTSTQTKKSRDERWQNVKDIFELKDGERLKDKHVLIIDDVLTTGATLMSGAMTLFSVPGITISAATAACAGA